MKSNVLPAPQPGTSSSYFACTGSVSNLMHYPRETFNTYSRCKLLMPCINVRIVGIGWPETFEAAVGFLSDESVSSGHFSEWQLGILKDAIDHRLVEIAEDLRRKRVKFAGEPVSEEE